MIQGGEGGFKNQIGQARPVATTASPAAEDSYRSKQGGADHCFGVAIYARILRSLPNNRSFRNAYWVPGTYVNVNMTYILIGWDRSSGTDGGPPLLTPVLSSAGEFKNLCEFGREIPMKSPAG
jgi:hypothetical protein